MIYILTLKALFLLDKNNEIQLIQPICRMFFGN